jgi:MFS family permease
MRDEKPLNSAIKTKSVVEKIGARNIFSILTLGTAGQIAWAVENSWFNTFVYDRITTDPNPVAWMVAVSAITATITTIIMGILSDRTYGKLGKRKPYIVFGYIFWGIITAIYPMIEWIQIVGVAVIMVIIADAVMTFFGSTANDAAYNAWITDIGHSSNRNRIKSINDIGVYLAQITALAAAGIIIDVFGYFIFFYVLGGIVTTTGVISAILVESTPVQKEDIKSEKSIIREFTDLVNLRMLKDNRTLFLLFLYMALTGVGSQIYIPYLFIFLEHYIGFSKTEISVYIGIIMLFVMVTIIVIGIISHKFNRKSLVLIGSIIGSTFTVLIGFVGFLLSAEIPFGVLIFVIYFIGMIPSLAAQIAHGGWLLDKYPEGDVGKFQGIRMIFMVLLPMVIGPPLGATIIRIFGIPSGDGFIPTPELFIIGGIVSLLAIIPILFIKKSEGKIKFE